MLRRLLFGSDSAEEPLQNYVGIENQGATCYLNSLLQTLYHLGYFRNAAFDLPTADDSVAESIPLALQAVFHRLHSRTGPASTRLLTRSFGWTREQSLVQHDVQELTRVLVDKLGQKMKGTSAEGLMDRLFMGTMCTYVQCCDMDYTSVRREPFYDIQLPVRGFRNIQAALNAYTAPELLDGENKYCVEKDGRKSYARAYRGVCFQSFPPVLFFHLRRFELDFQTMTYHKIHSRFEFPETLDLARYREPKSKGVVLPAEPPTPGAATPDPFSPAPGAAQDFQYSLFSVLVHYGHVDAGHYYCYVRPNAKGDNWYCFNDTRVTKVRKRDAVDVNFGDDSKPLTSAYMLVYVRRSLRERLLHVPDAATRVATALAEKLARLNDQDRRDTGGVVAQGLAEGCVLTDHSLRNLTTRRPDSGDCVPDLTGKPLFDTDRSANVASGAIPVRIPVDSDLSALTELVKEKLSESTEIEGLAAGVRLWVQEDHGRFRPLMTPKHTPLRSRLLLGDGLGRLKDDGMLPPPFLIFAEVARHDALPLNGRDVAPLGEASQSSEAPDHGAGLALRFEESDTSYSQTAESDAAPWWEVRFRRRIDRVDRVVLVNRVDGQEPRNSLRDIVVCLLDEGGNVTWESGVLNPENALLGPPQIIVDLERLGVTAGASRVRIRAAPHRPHLPLSLNQVRVFTRSAEVFEPCLPSITGEGMLLFVKQFLPDEQRTAFIGTVVAEDSTSAVGDLWPTLAGLIDLPVDVALSNGMLVYLEDPTTRALRAVNRTDLLCDTDIRSGSVLLIQRRPSPTAPFPTAPVFLAHIAGKLAVEFCALEDPFTVRALLHIEPSTEYAALQTKVAEALLLPQDTAPCIQFWGWDRYSKQPFIEPFPVEELPFGASPKEPGKPADKQPLALRSMVFGAAPNRLLFHTLRYPVAQWESKTRRKVHCFDHDMRHGFTLDLLLPDDLPPEPTAEDLIDWAVSRWPDGNPAPQSPSAMSHASSVSEMPSPCTSPRSPTAHSDGGFAEAAAALDNVRRFSNPRRASVSSDVSVTSATSSLATPLSVVRPASTLDLTEVAPERASSPTPSSSSAATSAASTPVAKTVGNANGVTAPGRHFTRCVAFAGDEGLIDTVFAGPERLADFMRTDVWRVDLTPPVVPGVDPSLQQLVLVCHVNTANSTVGGSLHPPCLMYVAPNETVVHVMQRVQQRFHVPRQVFAAWKLYLLDREKRATALRDEDLPLAKYRAACSATPQNPRCHPHLALFHPYAAHRKREAVKIN